MNVLSFFLGSFIKSLVNILLKISWWKKSAISSFTAFRIIEITFILDISDYKTKHVNFLRLYLCKIFLCRMDVHFMFFLPQIGLHKKIIYINKHLGRDRWYLILWLIHQESQRKERNSKVLLMSFKFIL